MLIVDAQVHIWANHVPTVPTHRQVATFSKDDLLREMDEAGVDAAVIHPPGWDPGSNELAVEAARQHPGRLAVLGHFPLDRPASRPRARAFALQLRPETPRRRRPRLFAGSRAGIGPPRGCRHAGPPCGTLRRHATVRVGGWWCHDDGHGDTGRGRGPAKGA